MSWLENLKSVSPHRRRFEIAGGADIDCDGPVQGECRPVLDTRIGDMRRRATTNNGDAKAPELGTAYPHLPNAETINLAAVLAGPGAERRLVELAVVKGLQPGGDYVLEPASKRTPKGGRS